MVTASMTIAIPITEPVETTAEFQPTLETKRVKEVESSFTTLPKGTAAVSSGWRLAQDIGVEVTYGETGVIVSFPLLDEYGIGREHDSAVQDLLLSLVEYRQSLTGRRARLAEELKRHFAVLETILERSPE